MTDEDELICHCFGVRKSVIIDSIKENDLQTVDQVKSLTNACSGCGTCRFQVRELVKEYGRMKSDPTVPQMNLYRPKSPLKTKVLSTEVLSIADGCETKHIVFDISTGDYPFVEGQSLGIVPPGEDKKGKSHKLRLYSIASPRVGEETEESSVAICVKRLIYVDDNSNDEVQGVCSSYLCGLKVGDEVDITGPVGHSFILPDDDNADIILVATGTGIAPFRGFWRHLFLNLEKAKSYQGHVYLYFGVPYSNCIYYKKEMEAIQALASVSDRFHVNVAVSREEKSLSGEKKYVYHLIEEQKEKVWKLLMKQSTYLYFCGLKGMEKGVENVFDDIAKENGVDWEEFYRKMKKDDKRCHVEVY
ncbi:MAG: ferredoxin--NADP(+) reductase [Planctomycetota bacterium]|nr:MAG: ferredoxin--NADP(+) reductase [Planctomycetota bacterium]